MRENDTQDNLSLAHKLPESSILGQSQPPNLIIPTFLRRWHSFHFLSLKTESSVHWLHHKCNNPNSDSHTDQWTLFNEESPFVAFKKVYFLNIVISHLYLQTFLNDWSPVYKEPFAKLRIVWMKFPLEVSINQTRQQMRCKWWAEKLLGNRRYANPVPFPWHRMCKLLTLLPTRRKITASYTQKRMYIRQMCLSKNFKKRR